MNPPPQYWHIYTLPAPRKEDKTLNQRYEYQPSTTAKASFQFLEENKERFRQAVSLGEDHILEALLDYFMGTAEANDIQAKAGLCLRCYISPAILSNCKKLASASVGLSTSNPEILFLDLVHAALDDDGKTFFILDSGNKNKPLLLNSSSILEATWWPFSIEILKSYNHQHVNPKSLKNWTYFTFHCNKRIQDVLKQHGFNRLSGWALMNRDRPASHLRLLSQRSRYMVEVFHKVYRHDTLLQHQQSGQASRPKKCPDPTPQQLEKMMTLLHQLNVVMSNPDGLLEELRQVAQELLDIEYGPRTEPLPLPDPTDGALPRDIPSPIFPNPDKQEEEGMLIFLREQQLSALQHGICQSINDRTAELNASRRRQYTPKFLPGLRLIYCEGRSLRDIWQQLGFSSQPVAAKVLALNNLIHQVRSRMVKELLSIILVRAQEMGLTTTPPNPDYLDNLITNIQMCLDEEIFKPAFQELKDPRSERNFNSIYAEEIRRCLEFSSL